MLGPLWRVIRQVQFFKRVGASNYFAYRMAPKGTPVKLPVAGSDVWVRKGTPDMEVATSCLSGEFESLRYLLPSDFNGVIVDAGGYIGTATLALKKLFPSSKVIVIEPSEANIEVLKKNLSGVDNVQVVYGALVGTDIETIELKDRGTGEWGFTAVRNPDDNNNAVMLHETPAFSLSRLGVDVSEIGILKLDIEGGEYDLFVNDMKTLREIPVIFAELHDRIQKGCTDLFHELSEDRIVVKEKGEKYLSIKR